MSMPEPECPYWMPAIANWKREKDGYVYGRLKIEDGYNYTILIMSRFFGLIKDAVVEDEWTTSYILRVREYHGFAPFNKNEETLKRALGIK